MIDFAKLVDETLFEAWRHCRSELIVTGLEGFNESVFRYFFIRSLPVALRTTYETEWLRRVDLCLRTDSGDVAIEFKFYVYRRHFASGGPGKAKGGAGRNNEREMFDSWKRLAELSSPQAKFLILAYEQNPGHSESRRSFHSSYCDIGARLADRPDCPFCGVNKLQPIRINDSQILHCQRIRVL